MTTHVTLPGENGLWVEVSRFDYAQLLRDAKMRNPNIPYTVSDELSVISEALGCEIRFVDYKVYRRRSYGDWRDRECERMKERQLPVWHKEPFWEKHVEMHGDHFVHVSGKDRRLLAYTSSYDKGNRDIQTPIKPGRYLRQYFGEILSEKRIAFMAAWQVSGQRPEDASEKDILLFAKTPDEIAEVYVKGPSSCMDGWHFGNFENHPARVYGAGDLAVAYIEREDDAGRKKIVARCLVWPEKKVAGRVYPTPEQWVEDRYTSQNDAIAVQNSLSALLKGAGYTFLTEDGSFDGARILKLRNGENWVMPYLDNRYGFDRHSKDFWVLCQKGKYHSSTPDGLFALANSTYCRCIGCLNYIEEEKDAVHIYQSWDSKFQRPTGRMAYCCECASRIGSFVCSQTGVIYSNAHTTSTTMPDGGVVEGNWYDHQFYVSSFSGQRFNRRTDPPVTIYNGDIWSTSELNSSGFMRKDTWANAPVSQRDKVDGEAIDFIDNYNSSAKAICAPELAVWRNKFSLVNTWNSYGIGLV